MAPPESVSSATVTDLATARRGRKPTSGSGSRKADGPDAGSPDAASPDAASPDAGSPDAASPDAASPDAASQDAARAPRVKKPANRRFDVEKVERLKAEIAEGRYSIDPVSVADRFIEHERNG